MYLSQKTNKGDIPYLLAPERDRLRGGISVVSSLLRGTEKEACRLGQPGWRVALIIERPF